jgi:hypothetical protein
VALRVVIYGGGGQGTRGAATGDGRGMRQRTVQVDAALSAGGAPFACASRHRWRGRMCVCAGGPTLARRMGLYAGKMSVCCEDGTGREGRATEEKQVQ